jgi:hypothetical protein
MVWKSHPKRVIDGLQAFGLECLRLPAKLGIGLEYLLGIGQPWVNKVTMYTHMREVIRES